MGPQSKQHFIINMFIIIIIIINYTVFYSMIYAAVSALCPGSLSYLGWWRVNQLGAPLLVAGGRWLVAGGWWTGDTPAHTPLTPTIPLSLVTRGR